MNSATVAMLLYVVLGIVTYGVYRIVLDHLTDEQLNHADRRSLHGLLILGAVLWPIIWVVQLLSLVYHTIKTIFNSSES